jgi:site-specific DNA-methyltransferase (adenine-specific)
VTWKIIEGDALEVLKGLPDNSCDSMVTDPPAGIGFMGKTWDTPSVLGVSGSTATMPAMASSTRNPSCKKCGGRKRAGPATKACACETPDWNTLDRLLDDRDRFVGFLREVFHEAYRVLKPGSHILVWALPRTSHWTGTAIEEAGFDLRDCITHLFATGFPKSLDVSKAIDKAAGAERPVVGQDVALAKRIGTATGSPVAMSQVDAMKRRIAESGAVPITIAATEAARQWEGWGTALKPAAEFWFLARKPIEGTVAANVLKWGVGALNIDGCRIAYEAGGNKASNPSLRTEIAGGCGGHVFPVEPERRFSTPNAGGRWPSNALFSHSPECSEESCASDCPVAELDRQSGSSVSRRGKPRRSQVPGNGYGMVYTGSEYADHGGASRFFYCAKPSRSEREAGLEALPLKSAKKWNEGGIQGRRDAQAAKVIADASVESQGFDARGRTLIREDGTKTIVDRWIPQHRANVHPTVKAKALMAYLCRLITPPGGVVLDPFAGSGSTGLGALAEGFSFVGIEQDAEYCEIARARLAHAAPEVAATNDTPSPPAPPMTVEVKPDQIYTAADLRRLREQGWKF